MVPESPLEPTEHGVVAKEDGWFVVNARDARWQAAAGRGAVCNFEGEADFRRSESTRGGVASSGKGPATRAFSQ